MGIPKPPAALDGHCSVIHDEMLYTFSPDGFQSIALKEGGKWKKLPMGVSVTGGVCVNAPSADGKDDHLYIVGGSSDNDEYSGFQRYAFKSNTWESLDPVTRVTANRQNHGAVFINSTSSILIYAGSQNTGDNDDLSSQTFLLSTTSPYNVLSFSSDAPPANKPMLMPWNATAALMVGGDATNDAVWTFDTAAGWHDLGVKLPRAVSDQSTTQCSLVFGDDGSKVLETFDMGETPNTVTANVLMNPDGTTGTGESPADAASSKRDLTLKNWPKYNSTLAPDTKRSGYSIAQDAKSRAVISGGNDQDPIAMFDQKDNSWLNATELIEGQQAMIQSNTSPTASSTSASETGSSTATASATDGVAAAGGSKDSDSKGSSEPDGKSNMSTVLGATLGTIFGIAAVCIILLLLLRWKKKKQRGPKEGQEKDRMSFQDRGADFMREAGGSAASNYPDYRKDKGQSWSSVSIMAGRIGNNQQQGGGHKRGATAGSDTSTAPIMKQKSPLGYSDNMEMSSIKEKDIEAMPSTYGAPPKGEYNKELGPPAHTHTRSSGWSRYFANNETTNLASMPSVRSTFTSVEDDSHYTDSRILSQGSTQIAPLDLGATFDSHRLSRVASGSPTVGHSTENLHGNKPMQAELARANSVNSDISRSSIDYNPTDSTYYNSNRAPSSAYTESVYDSKYGQSYNHRANGSNPFFLNDDRESYSTYRNTNGPTSQYGNQNTLGAPPTSNDRGSTVTIFPGPGAPTTSKPPAAPTEQTRGNRPAQSDMSWLNLSGGAV